MVTFNNLFRVVTLMAVVAVAGFGVSACFKKEEAQAPAATEGAAAPAAEQAAAPAAEAAAPAAEQMQGSAGVAGETNQE
jgi:hypothetical protein